MKSKGVVKKNKKPNEMLRVKNYEEPIKKLRANKSKKPSRRLRAMKIKKPKSPLRKDSHGKQETHRQVASHISRENQGSIANQRTQKNILRELGRVIAGSYYDHQEVRITEFNRIRDIIRRKIEGIALVGKVEEKKEEKEKYQEKFIDKKIPIYLKGLVRKGELTEKEESYINKILEVQKNAEKYEREYKKLMQDYVEEEPIYIKFLSKIKGISAVLSSNLIKEFGYCENAPHISSLWKYCGMHVVDGVAPKRKKGQQLDFSIKRRTMVWKISDSFIKQRTPFYRAIYDIEKKRQLKMMEESQVHEETHKNIASQRKQENHLCLANSPKSLGHADNRAKRKMVKIFLAHYWQACKEIQPPSNRKPLEQSEPNYSRKPSKDSESYGKRKPSAISEQQPYASSKLGHKHISSWKEAVLAQVKKKPDDRIKNET